MATTAKTEQINGHDVRILHSKSGFGITFRCYTERPYAISIDGQTLKTEGGAVRTYASRETAEKAARKFALAGPAFVRPCPVRVFGNAETGMTANVFRSGDGFSVSLRDEEAGETATYVRFFTVYAEAETYAASLVR